MESPLDTDPQTAARIARTIASEIGARTEQVGAAVKLLDEGSTVPFVARYRKEATGGLDDTQLRTLSDRLAYLRELEARRQTILGSIKEQGKLTGELAKSIAGAETKAQLEDIYLPYKPKRRTKAMIARGERAGTAGPMRSGPTAPPIPRNWPKGSSPRRCRRSRTR